VSCISCQAGLKVHPLDHLADPPIQSYGERHIPLNETNVTFPGKTLILCELPQNEVHLGKKREQIMSSEPQFQPF
jgi:hypothetical protein